MLETSPLGIQLMMAKATAALLLIPLSFFASVGCKNAKPATKNSIDTGVATINLSAVTKSNQTQTFREVTRASLLPKMGFIRQYRGQTASCTGD